MCLSIVTLFIVLNAFHHRMIGSPLSSSLDIRAIVCFVDLV